MNKVYNDHRFTFYCNMGFDRQGNIGPGRTFTSINNKKRSRKLEWEHIVPAHAFGRSFPEWRSGHPQCRSKKGSFKGRNCARKMSVSFREMEGDPYNLVPAIGEVNQKRSNFSFAELPKGEEPFAPCKIKFAERKVEPPPEKKGNVARIYQYMDQTYPGRGIISKKNRPLFAAWDKQDPVDEFECERYRRIKAVTGLENPVLAKVCSK